MILDAALDYGFSFNSLNLVRHPLISHNFNKLRDFVYDSVFISSNNNKELLNEIIEKEREYNVLTYNKLRMFMHLNNKSNSVAIVFS